MTSNKNRNMVPLSAQFVSSIVLSTSRMSNDVSLSIVLGDGHNFVLIFIDEETEVLKNYMIFQHYTSGKWQGQDLKLGLLFWALTLNHYTT